MCSNNQQLYTGYTASIQLATCVYSISVTVEPLYSRHPWASSKCPPEKIIKIIKVSFGSDIWIHAVLVMTFANNYGERERVQRLVIYCKITPRNLN
jgi:hypothetical protein